MSNVGILLPSSGSGKMAPAQPVELYTPGKGEILFRVESCAQNPIDQKQADLGYAVASFPTILGVDAAGVVESVGPDVEGFKPGDRIATMTPLGQAAKYGVYQKYAIARPEGTILLPKEWSFDDGATVPLAFITASIGLFSGLGIPLPLDKEGNYTGPETGVGEWLLVWGGSSSVGALAVQLAKAAGFRVIAVAGPGQGPYVKGLGADRALDYHDPHVIDTVHAIASLSLAFDAIGTLPTQEASVASLTDGGKVAVTLNPAAVLPDGVEMYRIQAGTIYDEARKEELKGIVALWKALMEGGKIKPNPVKVMPDGLNSIDEGFELQRKSKISGFKVIYHPQETEA